MTLEQKAGAFLGVLFLWFSPFLSFYAITSVNCTGGEAFGLYAALPCSIVTALGWLLVFKINRSKMILPFLVPAFLGGIWQSWFFIKLAKGHFVDGVSACFVITGYHPEHDASIVTYILLWGVLSVVFWLGGYLALRTLFKKGDHEIDE